MDNDKDVCNGDGLKEKKQTKSDKNEKEDDISDVDGGGDYLRTSEYSDDLNELSADSDASVDIVNGQPIELDDKRYDEASDFEHYSEHEYESYESGKEGGELSSEVLKDGSKDGVENSKDVKDNNEEDIPHIEIDDIKQDEKDIIEDDNFVETEIKNTADNIDEDNVNDVSMIDVIENQDDIITSPRSDKCGHFEEDDEDLESANQLESCEVRSEIGEFEEDYLKDKSANNEEKLENDSKKRKGITPIQYPTPEKRIRLNSEDKDIKEKSEIPVNDYSRHLKIVLRDAVFYFMKWENEKNMNICKERSLWMTSDLVENMINDSFKNTGNVILLFSLNGTDQFQGFARIIGGSDRSYPEIDWSEGDNHKTKKFRSIFLLDWISKGLVSFDDIKISNKLNKDKSFKFGNDGQELDRYCAIEICKSFKKDDSVDIHRIISSTRNSRAAVPILTANCFSSNHRSSGARIPSLLDISMRPPNSNSRTNTRRPSEISKHTSEGFRHRATERHTSNSRPVMVSRSNVQRSSGPSRSPRDPLLRKPLIPRQRRAMSPPPSSRMSRRSPPRKPESMAIRPPSSRPLLSAAERLRRDATHMNPRDVLSTDSPHRRRGHKTSFIDVSTPHTRYRDEPVEDSRSKGHRSDERGRSIERPSSSRYSSYRSSVKREKTPDRVREGYSGNLGIHYKPTAEKYMGTANISRDSRNSKSMYPAGMDDYMLQYSRIEPPIPPRYPPAHYEMSNTFTGIQGYSSNGQRSQRSNRENSKRERH